MRERLGWTQSVLAEKLDTNQNAVYRLESPDYGKATLTTLKKVAAAMDVALVVRFVPFSELVDWVSGTPHLSNGLDYSALNVQPFDDEETDGIFDRSQVNIRQAVQPPPTLLDFPNPSNTRLQTQLNLAFNSATITEISTRPRLGTQRYQRREPAMIAPSGNGGELAQLTSLASGGR